MKFHPLEIPHQWEHYWTKYPEGYTILEALFNWVKQTNDLVVNVNNWNEYLDDFVETFDKDLRDTVIDVLTEWKESGFIAVIFDEAMETQLQHICYNVMLYGAKGDGTTDDTAAIQSAIIAAMETGGVVLFPRGYTFLISSIGQIGTTNNKQVILSGYGAKLKSIAIESGGNTLIHLGENWQVHGLELVGYISYGSSFEDVYPTYGIGIRAEGAHNAVMRDLKIRRCSFDGIYVANEAENVLIENCDVAECFRNNISVVDTKKTRIIGGKYGWAGLKSIVIEPKSDESVYNVEIDGILTDHCIHVVGNSGGLLDTVSIRNSVLDGDQSALTWTYIKNIILDNLQFLNGAHIAEGNFRGEATSGVSFGKCKATNITGLELAGENLINCSSNSLAAWSLYGSTVTTPNVTLPNSKHKGVQLFTAAGLSGQFTQDIAVETGAYYTFGGRIHHISGEYNHSNIRVMLRDADNNTLAQCSLSVKETVDNETNTYFQVPAGATKARISIGNASSGGGDRSSVISELYLYKGLGTEYTPNQKDRQALRMETAPTAGTWAVGDRVVRYVQEVGQPKAWVCTAAGSPGTWTSEGNL